MRKGMVVVVAAFVAIYVIWGTTYLAIKVVVGVLPPFLMSGVRSVVAGGVLYAWARWRGAAAPGRALWLYGVVTGLLLFGIGHGTLFWAAQRVPSGMAAVLESTVLMWTAVFESMSRGGSRPSSGVVAGVLLGLGGLVWINLPSTDSGVPLLASAVLVTGAVTWALGSLWYRGERRPASGLLSAALPLLGGGAFLLVLSALVGEPGRLSADALQPIPLLALGYLIVPGSVIAFSAYTWLMGEVSPTRVASYGYVNPVIALFVGWLPGGERLAPGLLPPIAAVLLGVVLIVTSGPRDTAGKAVTDEATGDGDRVSLRLEPCPVTEEAT